MNDEDIYPHGALNIPDIEDYRAEHLLGIPNNVSIPVSVYLKTIPGNQGVTLECTSYSASHGGKQVNEVEHQIPNLVVDYVRQWQKQGEFGTRVEKGGDYVQTALKNLVKNGIQTDKGLYYFTGYAQVNKEDILYWLSIGHPVITSGIVTTTNFKNAKLNGYWTGNDGIRVSGHAFPLMGYEENGDIIALNSWGPTWGKFGNGTFKIKKNIIADLDTCYILYDKVDATPIFRDVNSASPFAKEIKYILEAGIMKGYNSDTLPPEERFFLPEKPVTRAELAATLYRILTKE